MRATQLEQENNSEDELDMGALRRSRPDYSVDDLTKGMESQMKIARKKKSKSQDVSMDTTKGIAKAEKNSKN